MAPRKKAPYGRVVKAEMPLAEDVVLHVTTLDVAGESLVEVREFIKSTETYGRGLTLSAADALSLGEALING